MQVLPEKHSVELKLTNIQKCMWEGDFKFVPESCTQELHLGKK